MRLGLLASMLAMLAVAAACGSGSGGEDGTPTAGPTTFPQDLIASTVLMPADIDGHPSEIPESFWHDWASACQR